MEEEQRKWKERPRCGGRVRLWSGGIKGMRNGITNKGKGKKWKSKTSVELERKETKRGERYE